MAARAASTRSAARREALLEAASAVFLAHGFAGATLDHIIARAGGSRATLYAQFGNKEGLFAAIIGAVAKRMTVPLAAARTGGAAPKAALTAFARRFLGAMLEPESLALYRLVAGESHRFPDLGREVFRAGPEVAAAALAQYLREATRQGALTVRRPDLAARAFLEMIKGDLHTRSLFGAGPKPSSAEIEATIREAVRIFLDGNAQAS